MAFLLVIVSHLIENELSYGSRAQRAQIWEYIVRSSTFSIRKPITVKIIIPTNRMNRNLPNGK